MAEQKVDRRVRRTREQLKKALAELLQEKPLRDITVRELTERADVNRGTFYSHYQDLYDMLEQMEQESLDEFRAVLEQYPPTLLAQDLTPLLADVFGFVRRRSEMMSAILEQETMDRFLRQFSQVIYDKCLREWAGLYPLGDLSEPNYCLEFLVSGTVNLVSTWARRGFREPPEEMAALTNQLIMRGVQSLRENG